MRLTASLLAAVLVTLALFYFMQSMISTTGRQIEKPNAHAFISFVRVNRDSQLQDGALRKQALPPPPSAATPSMEPPVMVFGEPAPPELPAPEAVMPELPPIEAGGKPYLGSYKKPAKKKTPPVPPPRAVARTEPGLKAPTSPKARKKPTAVTPPRRPRLVAKRIPRPAVEKTVASKSPATPQKHAQQAKHHSIPKMGVGGGAGGRNTPIGVPGLTAGPPTDAVATAVDEVVALLKSTPEYPRKAARNGKEGWVKIEFTITERGTVAQPKVVASKPRRIFDRAALKAIRKWRFMPKTVDGTPVSRRAVQVIEFKLGAG